MFVIDCRQNVVGKFNPQSEEVLRHLLRERRDAGLFVRIEVELRGQSLVDPLGERGRIAGLVQEGREPRIAKIHLEKSPGRRA